MKRHCLICSALLLLVLVACDPSDDDPSGFRYPLAVGNAWEYECEWNTYFYSDSSVIPVYEDTTTFIYNVSAVITARETLRGTIHAFRFVAEMEENGMTFTGEEYLNNREDGLYLYAYRGGALNVVPKRLAAGRVVFKGRSFDSIAELVRTMEQALPLLRVLGDSLIFEDPPIKTLSYPLEVGETWIYRQADNPWRMDKEVIAQDSTTVPAGQFFCYQVRYLYDMDEDGEWDEDIAVYDWIGEVGLVRRQARFSGMVHITASGDTVGYFDAVGVYRLTAVSLEPEVE